MNGLLVVCFVYFFCFSHTGVDPIQEAVIEYNKSRQPAVLPPDIYMGLRFADTAGQPSSDITGQQVAHNYFLNFPCEGSSDDLCKQFGPRSGPTECLS